MMVQAALNVRNHFSILTWILKDVRTVLMENHLIFQFPNVRKILLNIIQV